MEQTETKSHYVNLAGVTLPGYYVAKLDTRVGVEYRVVRVDLTVMGDESKQLAMFYASSDCSNVSPLVSDTSTYFGPLPLE